MSALGCFKGFSTCEYEGGRLCGSDKWGFVVLAGVDAFGVGVFLDAFIVAHGISELLVSRVIEFWEVLIYCGFLGLVSLRACVFDVVSDFLVADVCGDGSGGWATRGLVLSVSWDWGVHIMWGGTQGCWIFRWVWISWVVEVFGRASIFRDF